MRTGLVSILVLFLATVCYVIWHLWRLTPGGWGPKIVVCLLFILWMAAAFSGMMLRGKASTAMITALYEIGHPWLVAFVYMLIALILADILSLARVIPKGFLSSNGLLLAGLLGGIALLLAIGGIHYRHKYREELTLQTEKPLKQRLTVVLASDLHLGYSNRRAEFSRWVDLINAENPDLVLFAGDVVDIHVRPLEENNFAEEFARIQAPVYTILGNHEYISGRQDSERFFKEAGITLLRDSVARIGDIAVIGRDDRSNPSRKSLADLDIPSEVFTILLDHQPYNLEQAEESGIDFQFSGHTHRGQFWPLSWVTDAMYEKSWGSHRRGGTAYYVSSGLGIWGPKIRIGSRSEYLVLHIEASSDSK